MYNNFGGSIRTLVGENTPNTVETLLLMVSDVIASVQRTSRLTQQITMGSAPVTIIFGGDMFLPIPIINYFNLIFKCNLDHNKSEQFP